MSFRLAASSGSLFAVFGVVAALTACGASTRHRNGVVPIWSPSARATATRFTTALFAGDARDAKTLVIPGSFWGGSFLDDWARQARQNHLRSEGRPTKSGTTFYFRFVGSRSTGVRKVKTTEGVVYATERMCVAEIGKLAVTMTRDGSRVAKFNPVNDAITQQGVTQKGPGPNHKVCDALKIARQQGN